MLITADGHTRQVKVGSVSLSFYPLHVMIDKSKNGDLFVLHIIREGLLLTGSPVPFENIKSSFRQRSNYEKEIRAAADLGWLIVRFGAEFDDKLVQRRVSWCIRTVLIANSVQSGHPTFSSEKLSTLYPAYAVTRLIRQKDEPISSETFPLLRDFLIEYGKTDPCPDAVAPNDYLGHFERTENAVALHFLASQDKKENKDEYSSS
ncbi:hypothetical protein LMG27198_50500 [Methylocystis echinoides]|uniref:Uncharacterized protein n=2 Tax=Methylocystis echinoides TaxID=29468 RepID=A0A9W6GZM8_9HYPH|nr:hypothetical protein LMG27198_50500 [Methylocystis echinoides]